MPQQIVEGSIARNKTDPSKRIIFRGGKWYPLGADGSVPAEAMPPIRDFEANAAARATLMDQGLNDYRAALDEGYDPGAWKNRIARGIEGNGIGNFAADVLRDNPSEKGRAAELQFVDGALRTTTGANAPEPEVIRANRQFFRQPGESESVEPKRAELRTRFRDQSVKIAGPAYVAPKNALMPPPGGDQSSGAKKLPKAAEQAYMKRFNAGQVDRNKRRGDAANPYVARSEDVLNRLPPGSYVIGPDGSFGVIE